MNIQDGITAIGEYVFEGWTVLTSVTIPDSVTVIGYFTFSGCTKLTSVRISSSVESIGDNVFMGCTGLTSMTISDGVTGLGRGVFSGCTGLTSATFVYPNGWSVVSDVLNPTITPTSLNSTDLSNTSTAARYLKSTHANAYWTRS